MREAVIRVPASEYPTSGLQEFISLCREARVTEWTPVVCTGPGGIVAIQVERPFDEERLSALDHMAWWERIEHAEAGVGYFLKLDVPGLPGRLPAFHELRVSNEEITVRDRGLDISFVGNREALSNVM